MLNSKIFSLILLSVLMQNTSLSQQVSCFVSSIKDDRNTDQTRGRLELSTNVNGIQINDYNKIKLSEITSVKDDLGNSLYQKKSYYSRDKKYSSDNKITITLTSPLRKAQRIVVLEGKIKYFMPSEELKSIIKISNPLDLYNNNLMKNTKNLKIVLIDKKKLKNLKDKNEAEYNKTIKKLQEQGEIGNSLAETIDAIKSVFNEKSYASFNRDNIKGSFDFYIKDPNGKLIDIEVYNENNEEISYGSSSSNSIKTINLREEPKNSCYIKFILENEASVKEIPFKIENIMLP